MKKILLLSLATLMCTNVGYGYTKFSEISLREGVRRSNSAWIEPIPRYSLNCDDDGQDGYHNANNGILIITTRYDGVVMTMQAEKTGTKAAPFQCLTRDHNGKNENDRWHPLEPVGWCNKKCTTGYLFGGDKDSPYVLCNLSGKASRQLKKQDGMEVRIFDFFKKEADAKVNTSGVLCKACLKGFRRDGDKCVPANSTDDKQKPDDNNNQKDNEKKTGGGGSYCDQFEKYPERYACCKAGKATKWEPKNDLANGKCICIDSSKEWKNGKCEKKSNAPTCETMYAGNKEAIACCNSNDATWVADLNRCECNDENQTWDKKTFKCVDNGNNGGDDKPVVPAASECWYTLNIDIQCKNGNHFSKNTSVKLTNDQVTEAQCNTLKQNMQSMESLLTTTKKEVNTYAEIIKSVCGDGSASIVPVSEADLKAARATLQSFFANAVENASVWKTTDGSFNTARLASDLTAGVVLGTVGGVVSSKVIKKKQIEKGFEVLHCTIGGHVAADWGDTFSVGLN